MDLSETWSWIHLTLLAAILFYIYSKWEAGHFKRKGMKNLPYDFPIIGNIYRTLSMQEHMKESFDRVYSAFPTEKYVGFKQLNRNLIMLRDLELIKQISIKNFDHFPDHLFGIKERLDNLFGKNLFSLEGEKWRDMRATLSPAFTSSKMRNMFQFIVEIGEQMTNYYEEKMTEPESKEKGLIAIEMKDAFTRYTNDVIATSAFGLRVNSLSDRENIFYSMGKEASDFTGIFLMKFFVYSLFPKIAELFKLQLFSERVKDFFRRLVLDTMKDRTEKGIIRQDMIHLLIEAKKGSLKHEVKKNDNDYGFSVAEESDVGQRVVKRQWSDDDMVAQGLVFLVAGFETSSSLLNLMSHELVMNPEVQRKLQNEIDSVIMNKDGHLEYNDLMKMNYMDMVVSETLRKWPPVFFTDRKCSKQYNLPPPSINSTKECIVNEGESLVIPIYSIHHDPKYYPDPKTFNPERFSEENKSSINPMTFLPFGIGPRNCIGSRFALMETKTIMFYLLKKFDFVRIAKTQDPLVISPKGLNLTTEKGFWVGLKPRTF